MSLTGSVMELIQKPKEIIAFAGGLTIGDALDVMSHYEIFSAPVVNKEGKCVGHIDYLDLLCELVKLTTEAGERQVHPVSRAVLPEDLEVLTRRANDWELQQLIGQGRIQVSRVEPFFMARPQTTLVEAMAYMGQGVHHLIIVDDQHHVVNMVSQTDMVRHLAKDLAMLGAAKDKTVRDLALGQRAVFCVRNSDGALDAFYELHEEGVSGGAIVNAEGKLVGNLSRHDLKGTQGGTGFGVLNQSIMHFQRKHRVALAQRLVTVTPASTIGDIVATMAREKVHRVFVVEGGMVPRGLITQTDICRVLANHFLAAEHKSFSKKQAKRLMKEHCSTPLEFPLLFPPK